MNVLEQIRDWVWGPGMLTLLLGAGIFLTVAAGFPQFHVQKIWRATFGSLRQGGKSSLNAMLTALGGTIGTGNIAGVSAALAAGGPGALFWMAFAAVFGMATKYAEIWLAVRWRIKDGKRWRGGGMYVLERGLRMKRTGKIFAALCVFTSFGIGNTVQANTAASALRSGLHIPEIWSGLLLALLCAAALFGTNRIENINAKLVPVMGILYIAGSILCIAKRIETLPSAFLSVLKGAFRPTAAIGGAAGYTVSQAVRSGVARGLFTNEAGMGSAPVAHAAAEDATPEKQGYWGIVEVGLDTLLMCTLTGLVLLTADPVPLKGKSGFSRTLAAFQGGLGNTAGIFLCISMLCFALASMLAWAQYGSEAFLYLTGNRNARLYAVVFAATAITGACANAEILWITADLCNAAMCLPNLLSVIVLWTKTAFSTGTRNVLKRSIRPSPTSRRTS